ncbi:MAG TPA: D-aminoacyl-tRNA deacylase [Candidatus Sumerlaeota bacterium]|nr:MAG: D-tyrosyl-tRNA(Tyr) deacylase [candidate division BRC1 bacterium ADurb.BinA292]HPK02758.1 D-aminoacyl-tRNA deacylase [Candidatus Sumerlaeota bacterium]
MRVLIQRVCRASVTVDGELIGAIRRGLLLLVGIGQEDAADDGAALAPMADKILNLRILADAEGRMNRSLLDAGGEILAVSQFTLHADCRRGRRPSFTAAAPPAIAARLFDDFVARLRASGLKVETGRFGAMMDVALVNDGPVTIWLDSQAQGI